MTQDLTGQIIKGYELRQLLGEGGFGAVYLAYQRLIGREVAVKIILPQYANKPDFIRRFESEAQLVARLEHPHIVPLYDYWREPSGAYLVMRYLRGGSLSDLLSKEGAWQPDRVSEMLTQIAAALVVAHRQGVIHRDLKPENILLDENGNHYLTDFGIAKDLGGQEKITQGNAIVGSPAYISPEQIKGEAITPRTDIYMMGIVLFEMLAGQHPYPEATSATLMYKHLTEALPEVSKIKADIPNALNTVLGKATAKNPAERYNDILELASDFRRALRTGTLVIERDERVITSGTLTMPEPENPYKGLRAFQLADAVDFYGRDTLIQKLLTRLQETTSNSRFLAVVGPSGSGKSSVVKAGLLPALQRGSITDSDKWFMVEMVPGIDPMEELEATLLRVAVNPPDSLLTQLNEDERGFVRAVKRILPGDDSELLLVIDQFEELFTLVEEESQRTHLMDSLIAAVTDPRSKIRVIITLRADFYDRPLNYVRFGELMQQRTEIVLPLSPDEIEQAITRPADRVGLQLERGLVTTVVSDVKEQPGALPLLQYALTELFERRERNLLTLKAYHDIGGTMGALARRADELYAGLGKDGQEAARQMFLRLVTLGEGTEDTRRRVFQSELQSIGSDRETMEMVLDAFGRYRLLTFDNDPQTRASTVEVAHEALIRQWGRLRDWLDNSREDLRFQRRVTAAANDWQESKHDASFLARGNRLDQLELWFNNSNLALTDIEREYLHASIALREQQRAQELERQRREEELEKRSRDRLRMLVGVLAVAAFVATILSLIAVTQSLAAQAAQRQAEIAKNDAEVARDDAENNAQAARTAQREAEIARDDAELSAQIAQDARAQSEALALAANARTALNEFDPMVGINLALAANQVYQPPSNEVLRVLANSVYAPGVKARLTGHTGTVMSVDYSPTATSVVSASADGSLRLWDIKTGVQLWEFSAEGNDIFTTVQFSPDGALIVAGGSDYQVRLIDTATGQLVRVFGIDLGNDSEDSIVHTDIVTSVAFSSDGAWVISGSLDRSAILWDVATGQALKSFDQANESDETILIGGVMVVGFNPDNTRILIATIDETIANITTDFVDRRVRVFDIESGAMVSRMEPRSGFIRTAVFSPDGTTVAVGLWDGTNNGTIRFYNTETGAETDRIYAHTDIISTIAYAPDGRTLMSVSWDGLLKIWDLQTGVDIQQFTGFRDRLLTAAYSPDGQYIVMGVGNIGNNEITRERERAGADHSVWLIDLVNRATLRTIGGSKEWLWDVDLNSDGTLAVTGAGPLRLPTDGSTPETVVRIWDLQTGAALHTMVAHTDTVDGVAFNPNGENVLSGAWDMQVILWDAKTGEPIHRLVGHESRVIAVDISLDGTQGISADALGVMIVWDLTTGEEIRRIQVAFPPETADNQKIINSVHFSIDGLQVLAGLQDSTIRLFDLATGDEVRSYGKDNTKHTAAVNNAIFSANGRLIASTSNDGTVRIWEAATGDLIRALTGHSDRTLGVAFTLDSEVIFSTGSDRTVRMWDVATGEELRRFSGHTNWISAIQVTPDGKSAVSSAQDNTLRVWRVDRTAEDLITFAEDNRYIRPFSCNEQRQFRVALSAECAAETAN